MGQRVASRQIHLTGKAALRLVIQLARVTSYVYLFSMSTYVFGCFSRKGAKDGYSGIAVG